MVHNRKTDNLKNSRNNQTPTSSIPPKPKQKHKERLKSLDNKRYKVLKIICAILLLPTLFYGYAVYKYIHPTDPLAAHMTPLNNNKMTVSQILFKYAEVIHRLMTSNEKMKSLLVEEPLADIIKTKLRPVQERIASLRTQTSQYEKMDKIPGGPTQFMTSSLGELDKILNEQIFELGVKVMTIMTAYQIRVQEMIQTSKDVVHSHSDLFHIEERSMKAMIHEGIFLLPPTGIDIHNDFKANGTDVAVKLENMGKLYARREVMFEKILSSLFKTGDTSSESHFRQLDFETQLQELVKTLDADVGEELPSIIPEMVMDLLQIQGLIVAEMDQNKEIIEQTTFVNRMYIQSISDYLPILKSLDTEKRRPYFDLQAMVVTDIKNLHIRISNMQYKYLKIQPDSI